MTLYTVTTTSCKRNLYQMPRRYAWAFYYGLGSSRDSPKWQAQIYNGDDDMDRMIGTMTVIHGKGDVQVLMNHVVSREIQRLRAKDRAEVEAARKEFEKEMERMLMFKKRCDRLMKEKFDNLNEQPRVKENKVRDKIGFVLACFICWGMELGLIEFVGNERRGRK